MKKRIAIIGAGGHAKVTIDIILELNMYDIIGFFDDNASTQLYNFTYLGKLSEIKLHNTNIDCYVISIGDNLTRKHIYEIHSDLNWETLIHPKAVVSKLSVIDCGTVVCAGAIIQVDVKIGKHCIVNTNCNIDHETIIEDFVSVCPSATICGNVLISTLSFIGANSVIIQKIKIGENCIIGAGTVVIRDATNNSKLVGTPAKNIK